MTRGGESLEYLTEDEYVLGIFILKVLSYTS